MIGGGFVANIKSRSSMDCEKCAEENGKKKRKGERHTERVERKIERIEERQSDEIAIKNQDLNEMAQIE